MRIMGASRDISIPARKSCKAMFIAGFLFFGLSEPNSGSPGEDRILSF